MSESLVYAGAEFTFAGLPDQQDVPSIEIVVLAIGTTGGVSYRCSRTMDDGSVADAVASAPLTEVERMIECGIWSMA